MMNLRCAEAAHSSAATDLRSRSRRIRRFFIITINSRKQSARTMRLRSLMRGDSQRRGGGVSERERELQCVRGDAAADGDAELAQNASSAISHTRHGTAGAGRKRKSGCVVIATTSVRAALMLRRRALRGSKQEDRADSAASSSMKRRRRSSSSIHCRCCFRCAGFDDGDDFRRKKKRAVWTATEEGGERGAGDRVGAMLCDVTMHLHCVRRDRGDTTTSCTRLAGASSSSSACGKITRAPRSCCCAARDEDCRDQSVVCTSRCRVCGVASCDAFCFVHALWRLHLRICTRLVAAATFIIIITIIIAARATLHAHLLSRTLIIVQCVLRLCGISLVCNVL